MRNLDGSLEHPGNHPSASNLQGPESNKQRPSTRQMFWCTILGVAAVIQLSFVANQIIEGLQNDTDSADTCEYIEPLKIADTYEKTARIVIDYSLTDIKDSDSVVASLKPGESGIEVCGRDMRVYKILIVNHDIGFYEAPPIEPTAQLDN